MKGKVEAISIEKKGIKIDNNWFNPNENVWQFAEHLKVGETVEYEVDEEDQRQLKFIKKSFESKPEQKSETSKQIRRMNCVTNAIALITIQNDSSLANTKNVVDVAREFEKYIEGE
jgi:hypothetical protein